MPILAATAGLVLFIATLKLGARIANRWLRYAAIALGSLAALAVTGELAGSTEAAVDAGMYLCGMAVAYLLIFERGRNKARGQASVPRAKEGAGSRRG